MNLQTIKENLLSTTSVNQIVQFFQKNKPEVEGYFISLTDDEIDNDKFDLQSVCLGFINSPIFQTNKTNAEFVEIITLFAELFEKIGFYGAIGVVKANLPSSSSIRHRLNAVYQYSKIGSITDYTDKFDTILRALNKALDFSEVDYTGQVVQDTIHYYLLGKQAFEKANLTEQLGYFKTLFNSPRSKEKYKFLTHPTLNEYLDGYITEKIFIELIAEKVYTPSSIIQGVFQKLILDCINTADYLERYDNNEIRADVLNYGRADFTQPYRDLTPYDKVQLYCYFNMRMHFFTTYAIYEKIYTFLNINIFQKNRNFTFIDFGCGSLTSGLALASLHNDTSNEFITIKYIGIDIADSMIEKAKEFAGSELFSSQSEFQFHTNWDLIPNNVIENISQTNSFVVFNASYLFASSSLNENSLAAFVNKVVSKLDTDTYFVFQNPDRADRNEKYKRFKQQISHRVITSETQRIYYKNNQNSTFEPSSEVVNFEILSL